MTVTATVPAAPPVSVAEAKAYLRIEGSDEDALIAGLVRSAAELCEAFTGLSLVARPVREAMPAPSAWRRLGATPVRAVTGVEALGADGEGSALLGGAYMIDIDAAGDGWVRVIDAGGAARVRVSYEAGHAAEWNGVPETLRQGVVRLAAHFYTHRDGADDKGPPAAVAALWRPWRRLRIG